MGRRALVFVQPPPVPELGAVHYHLGNAAGWGGAMRPTTLRVNGRVIKVKYRGARTMPNEAGLYHFSDGLIEIRKDQSPVELRDTVLHELLHSILHSQGREYGGEVEEVYVRAIATGLIGVFRDNPRLVAWLTAKDAP